MLIYYIISSRLMQKIFKPDFLPGKFLYKDRKSAIIQLIFEVEKEGLFVEYCYQCHGTCSKSIEFELEGDTVHNVKFNGGCMGNTTAVSHLVEGMTVDEVEDRISGIQCGFKGTSCGDQLAKAVRAAYEQEQAKE